MLSVAAPTTFVGRSPPLLALRLPLQAYTVIDTEIDVGAEAEYRGTRRQLPQPSTRVAEIRLLDLTPVLVIPSKAQHVGHRNAHRRLILALRALCYLFRAGLLSCLARLNAPRQAGLHRRCWCH